MIEHATSRARPFSGPQRAAYRSASRALLNAITSLLFRALPLESLSLFRSPSPSLLTSSSTDAPLPSSSSSLAAKKKIYSVFTHLLRRGDGPTRAATPPRRRPATPATSAAAAAAAVSIQFLPLSSHAVPRRRAVNQGFRGDKMTVEAASRRRSRKASRLAGEGGAAATPRGAACPETPLEGGRSPGPRHVRGRRRVRGTRRKVDARNPKGQY